MKHKKSPRTLPSDGPLPTTPDALKRINRQLWPPQFMKLFPAEVRAATAVWATVVLGFPPSSEKDLELIQEQRSSLPLMWACLWRPMADGRTGIDVALTWSKMDAPVLRAALQRLSQARGVYFECLDHNRPTRTLILRDLFSGEIYRVPRVEDAILGPIRRWMRGFGLLVEVGDGTWDYVSAVTVSDALAELAPEEFLAQARGALTAAGMDPDEIDPAAPHRGLCRSCGIAFSAISRWLRQRPAPEPPRIFVVNTDGDRIEYQEAEIDLSAPAAARLWAALPAAEDFVRTDADLWKWISLRHTKMHAHGETLGELLRSGPHIGASANSPQRLTLLLRRLSMLCGERPAIRRVKVTRPWELQAGLVAEREGSTQTVVMGAGAPVMGVSVKDMKGKEDLLFLDQMRHQLGQTIESLGGTPRKLVRTPTGRTAVEGWLRKAEAHGLPRDKAKDRFLDLDPLREELRLPTIRSEIVSGTGGR